MAVSGASPASRLKPLKAVMRCWLWMSERCRDGLAHTGSPPIGGPTRQNRLKG